MQTRYVIYSAMQDCYIVTWLHSPNMYFRCSYANCKSHDAQTTYFTKKKKKINQIHVIDRIFTIFPHNINIRKKVKGT